MWLVNLFWMFIAGMMGLVFVVIIIFSVASLFRELWNSWRDG
jgi:hypothetical protein